MRDVLAAASADRASWAAFGSPPGAALLFSLRLGPGLARVWRRAAPHARDVYGVACGPLPDLSAAPALRSLVLFGRSVAAVSSAVAAAAAGPAAAAAAAAAAPGADASGGGGGGAAAAVEVSAGVVAIWGSGPLGGAWEPDGYCEDDLSMGVPASLALPNLRSCSLVGPTCSPGDMESVLGLARRARGGGRGGGGKGEASAAAPAQPAGGGGGAEGGAGRPGTGGGDGSGAAVGRGAPGGEGAAACCRRGGGGLRELSLWCSDPLDQGFAGSPAAWAAGLAAAAPGLRSLRLGALHARMPDAFWAALGRLNGGAGGERERGNGGGGGSERGAAGSRRGGSSSSSGGGGGGAALALTCYVDARPAAGAAWAGDDDADKGPPSGTAGDAPAAEQQAPAGAPSPRPQPRLRCADAVRRLNLAAPASLALHWGLPERPDLSALAAPHLRLVLPLRAPPPRALPACPVLEVDFDLACPDDAAAAAAAAAGGGGGGGPCKWPAGLLFPPAGEAAAAAARLGGSGYVARRIAVAAGPLA
jgi:hypothetical protein